MTGDEFDRLVKIGHGRAVVYLQKAADRAPYRDIVMRAANWAEDYTRLTGQYIYNLLQCFDDDELRSAAVNSSGKIIDYYSQYSIAGADLLALLAADEYEDAAAKLESLYARFYVEVAGELHSDNKNYNWLYFYLAFEAVCARGVNRLLNVIRDMAKLHSHGELDEANFLTFYHNVRYRLGKEVFDQAVFPLRAESPEIAQLCDRMKELDIEHRQAIASRSQNRQDRRILTFDEIYAKLAGGGRLTHEELDNTGSMSDDQLKKLAELAPEYLETEHIREILSLFLYHGVQWPLDPAPLIAAARDHSLKARMFILAILNDLRCESVREFAFELIAGGELETGVSLWARNYIATDRENFVRQFMQIDLDKSESTALHYVLNMISSDGYGEGNAPVELLEYIYENACNGYMRACTVREMHKLGMTDEHIFDECRFDSDSHVWEMTAELDPRQARKERRADGSI